MPYIVPLLVFFGLWIHGSILGLSDDEAYYWVLAQKPAWSYAYHPPAVAWLIAFFQKLLSPFLAENSAAIVRLPAAMSSGLILFFTLNWLERVGLSRKVRNQAALVLLSFFSFFALSWMMVPDIPLFLGWTLTFSSVWVFCFEQPKLVDFGKLFFGILLIMLAKYSGILSIFSAIVCLWCWAPRLQRMRGLVVVVIACGVALIPILYWNSTHAWGSILYQMRDRHGGEVSWFRWARFWAIQILLVGPILIGYVGVFISKLWRIKKKSKDFRLFYFLFAWIGPVAVVYWFQPLFSDFKPHWAFIVWWPLTLALACELRQGAWSWMRYHSLYGISLGVLLLLNCHFPCLSWVMKYVQGSHFDPKLDVTNDLYGWKSWGKQFDLWLRQNAVELPMVGSRYQTAAQAAWSRGKFEHSTFLPRKSNELDEWPDLQISTHQGPDWPKLTSSIFFVTDIRYDEPPAFLQAHCYPVWRHEEIRFGILVKWINVWRCDPMSR